MIKIDILTLFPESFSPLKTSILDNAVENGLLEFNIINIRDFSKDKHKKCDDYPFGGGAGMLMTSAVRISSSSGTTTSEPVMYVAMWSG